MKATLDTVLWNHHICAPCLLIYSAVAYSPEDRVVGQDRGGRPDRSTKAQVLFSGIIPIPAMHQLPEPRGIVGRRFETPSATAVIGCPRIPKPVIGVGSPGVHRRPGT